MGEEEDVTRTTRVAPRSPLNAAFDCARRVTAARTPSERQRTVIVNRSDLGSFTSNAIINTRFTPLTFIPLMLLQQFSSAMSLYFLLISTLQLWKAISPVHWITSWGPLAFVFTISCIKEAVDDIARARADARANAREFSVIVRGARTRCTARDIKVGDLVRVADDEEFPCDLLLLKTSERAIDGVALLETASLDGERTLKPRRARPELQALSVEDLSRLQGRVFCEPPNADLYRFDAKMRVVGSSSGGTPLGDGGASSLDALTEGDLPVGRDQLLQAGTHLRRTGWVLGVAVYTGADTRLAQNKSSTPTKRAVIDRTIDRYFQCIFILQAFLVLVLGTTGVSVERSMADAWYLSWAGATSDAASTSVSAAAGAGETMAVLRDAWGSGARALDAIFGARSSEDLATAAKAAASNAATSAWYDPLILPLRFFLLSSMLVPISLRVSMDLIKAYYAWLIARDDGLEYRGIRAKAANSAVIEDLGVVTHILCDKTGTLTDNEMSLAALAAGGRLFGQIEGPRSPESEIAAVNEEDEGGSAMLLERSDRAAAPRARPTLSDDVNLQAAISHGDESLSALLLAIALCNNVTSEHVDSKLLNASDLSTTPVNGRDRTRCTRFTSMSPDEEALTLGAARLGVALAHRAPLPGGTTRSRIAFIPQVATASPEVWVSDAAPIATYDSLAVLEFSSARARMSVVVRCVHDDRGSVGNGIAGSGVWLLTKGADEVVGARLALEANGVRAEVQRATDTFAAEGLRVLLVAGRKVPDREWEHWKRGWDEASRLVGPARDAALEEAADMLERGLYVIGVTAVRDKLATRAPEVVTQMQRAGIRVSMATGDRLETGVAVARSCCIVRHDSELCYVLGSSVAQVEHALVGFRGTTPRSVELSAGGEDETSPIVVSPRQAACGIVIDGDAMKCVFSSPRLESMFARALQTSSTLIAVRCSPKQKALLVDALQRSDPRAVVAAVGDGGNDVSMLQRAHMGIGIEAKEGSAAARAADVSVGSFAALEGLLLVHGRFSLRRTGNVALLTVARSSFIGFLQLTYNFFSGFSGTSLLDSTQLTLYNTVLTALPVIGLVLDADYTEARLLSDPSIFSEGQDVLPVRRILGWALFSLCVVSAALFCLFSPTRDLPSLATAAYTTLVFVLAAVSLLILRRWRIINVLFALQCAGGAVCLVFIRNALGIAGSTIDAEGGLGMVLAFAIPILAFVASLKTPERRAWLSNV